MLEELEEVYFFVAERIRLARKKADLTQEELADKIDMTRTSIVNIEAFRQRIMLHQLFEIAKATNNNITYFLPDTKGDCFLSAQEMTAIREERRLFDRCVSKVKKNLWKALTELDILRILYFCKSSLKLYER